MSGTASSSLVQQKPSHVPAALVYDFDIFNDPKLLENAPGRVLEIAREAPPIFWTPYHGGQWFIRSHESVLRASRDWESFSSDHMSRFRKGSQQSVPSPQASQDIQPVPITLDPPEHAKFRAPLNSVFSPKAMMALQGKIRALAVALIEKVKDRGHCEFMSEIAEPLPVTVFLEMFGLPPERQREFRDIVDEHLADSDSGHANSQRNLRKIADVMLDTITERKERPRDDLISLLWSSSIDGQPLTLQDMQNFCVLLYIAGLDTVMNAMGYGVRHLASDPALQAELRARPDLIAEAVEELLRRYTFLSSVRTVAKDIVYDGIEMKEGERVFLFNPAANVDASAFPDPDVFDLHRENMAHLAFGGGPHRCLGSHLARIELRVLYEEMLKRLPTFRLDADKPVRYRGGPVIGPRQVHLVWGS